MNEIEVGEYARTDRGVIYKYTEEERDDILLQDFRLFNDGKISKHSKNIIDLIEKDDYVNGCKVYENHKTYLTVHQKVKDSEVDYNYINHDEIKSIVTKEQYKSVEYIVKE